MTRDAEWEIYESEGANGETLITYFDPASKLTVVSNYAPGRTLLYNADEYEHIKQGNYTEEDKSYEVALLIDNYELKEKTAKEIWAEFEKSRGSK